MVEVQVGRQKSGTDMSLLEELCRKSSYISASLRPYSSVICRVYFPCSLKPGVPASKEPLPSGQVVNLQQPDPCGLLLCRA